MDGSGSTDALGKEPPFWDAADVQRVIRRMASSIVERTGGTERLLLVGIRRGGEGLAARLAAVIGESESAVPVGHIDFAFYRDDTAFAATPQAFAPAERTPAFPDPKVGPSEIPMHVTGMNVVLVDDVLQTGRTVRAAIECLHDYGRPRRIWLSALVDRGGRELPIAADFVGKQVEVPATQRVHVQVAPAPDERDGVWIGAPHG